MMVSFSSTEPSLGKGADRIFGPGRSTNIPTRFGLRHRAGFGITEKTDALAIVISEQSGKISYIKNGEFYSYKNIDDLRIRITEDLLI